ncbi:MAG: rRNA pseudouridine synthase [Thermoanaerobaculales bacterium]|nr:rRNA pseudouridine synthase [Thermoanaerobaculales bacterium]
MSEERVQKIVARSGRCSRREAERLIREGRVTVNGHVIKLGTTVDPQRDHIKVDGKALKAPEVLRYILLYKPRQVMTTCDDPEERRTVIDLIRPTVRERVYPVGRLDYQSEGLLLLTNDGDLAAQVGHPRYGVIREYMVKVRGDLDQREAALLRRGAFVDGRKVVPKSANRERGTRGGNSWWRVEVTEGRTHEVRELFFRAGHQVQRLRRTAIGPLRDDRMGPAHFRELTQTEIKVLRRAVRSSKQVTQKSGSERPSAPKRKKSLKRQ